MNAADTTANRIVDGLFIRENIGRSIGVPIEGIRGVMSPFPDCSANRVILTAQHWTTEKIREVMLFFTQHRSGLTWIVLHDQLEAGLREDLQDLGFRPGRFAKVAGMYLQTKSVITPDSRKITVNRVTSADKEKLIYIVSSATGATSSEYFRYLLQHGAENPRVTNFWYLAYIEDCTEPVGYSSSIYFDDGRTVMLNGAGVVEPFRRQGIYTQMLSHRIQDAISAGRNDFIIQSARDSSFPTCVRFGFQEVCEMEFYQWSPESAST